MEDNFSALFAHLQKKGQLKQDVYDNTLQAFNTLKEKAAQTATLFHNSKVDVTGRIPFDFHDKGSFEFEIRFGGDILLFMMHTNIFEFPRAHELFKTTYLREDKSRSYCGVINIYNFLGDSFTYKRLNDVGYLIGRIFINKDSHYHLEGKKELGLLYNNFENDIFDDPHSENIMISAIEYTINFDLLTPPYQAVQQISVYDIQTTLDNMQLKTGKRLGFKFQADIKGAD